MSCGDKSTTSNEKLSGKDFYSPLWIIDTMASNHMIGNINRLINMHDISPSPVKLSDGRRVFVFKCGSVRLSPNFVSKNMIYIPQLKCYLLSVSQLLKQVYGVTFTSDSCDIQDHTLRILIGVGEQRDGLYYFKEVRSIQMNPVIGFENRDLWH